MNPVYAVLLAISEEKEECLEGRTLLQKKLYFLSVLMKKDFQFHPHYYGPYSANVAAAVDSLVSAGFLKEEKVVFAAPNVFGEGRRYSYTITPDGEQLLESISSNKVDGFDKWQEKLRRLNSREISSDFNLLSIAAKMHYILSEDKQLSANNICNKGKELGWQITVDDIQKVANDLISLGLIREVSVPQK